MYSQVGRPSVPPEQLLKATVLMALYSVRSERAFCERLNYDLLFKWFLDLPIDAKAFDATTFTKNRSGSCAMNRGSVLRGGGPPGQAPPLRVQRSLLRGWDTAGGVGVAQELQAQARPGPPGWAVGPQRRGRLSRCAAEQPHPCLDHRPQALLARKSNNTAARLCYAGHLLMENRNAVIVDIELTQADGYAERAAAAEMLARLPRRRRRRTVAADKAYDTAGFVAECRDLGVTPHVAQNTTNRRSAIDGLSPATPATAPASASAPGSRNPSAGSRPSPADSSSATGADNATGPGSSLPAPPTTSSASRHSHATPIATPATTGRPPGPHDRTPNTKRTGQQQPPEPVHTATRSRQPPIRRCSAPLAVAGELGYPASRPDVNRNRYSS